jgi:hypothetical protein
MDASQPPLICDQCGRPITTLEKWTAVQKENQKTQEPGEATGAVVHEDCWPAWAEAHGVESN